MTKNIKNIFLEKAIENWLTKTNELGYQMPFCQCLISEGYNIVHISKHNAFEQGKDIIAIDRKGRSCAFQLKGGNITSSKWRNEVRAEVEELIELSIKHPRVKSKKWHKSYLVTNGNLSDKVRLEIEDRNENKWREHPLELILFGELLKKFINISGNFFPQEIDDYKSFLDLYFFNGKELVNEKMFSLFISKVLRLDEKELKREERKRNIASAITYTGYIIAPFKKENNYISIVQILGLLCGHIFALVARYQLPESYWKSSLELLWYELKYNGLQLEKEIIEENSLKNLLYDFWDGEIFVYREHLAISYLLSFKISQIIEDDKDAKDISAHLSKIEDSFEGADWGETALYPVILLSLYYQKTDSAKAIHLLQQLLEYIVECNGKDGKGALMSPYYSITTIIKNKFGLLDTTIEDNFIGRSYLLKPIVDLLAKKDARSVLADNWEEVTYIAQEYFAPQELWQHFLWRSNEGELKSEFPKQPQSWQILQQEAEKIDSQTIPQVLQNFKKFIPIFLLIYPHRISSNYLKYLDDILQ